MPIDLIPTEAMIKAGIAELKQEMSEIEDDLLDYFDGDEEEVQNKLSDVACFVWQAMYQAESSKE